MKKKVFNKRQFFSNQVHIRRDGGFICIKGTGEMSWFYQYDRHIKFSEAHKVKELQDVVTCKDCVKRYYEILAKMPNVVVNGKIQT